MQMVDISSLDKLFRPTSVAIVGASPQAGTPRNIIVRVLLKHGFAGRVYPVSRSHAEIEGLKTFATIADIPQVPDVALVITPAETVPGIIAECGRKGIRAAIVFSSGFEEVEGGKDLAARTAAAAKENNVAMLGVNCQGIWSVQENTMLTFGSSAARLDALKHAPIAVVSQSGALAAAIGNYLQTNGIGCSYVVSVGNETSMDLLDVLAWLVEQDDVKVVALYIEGLSDASRIIGVAQRAAERGIQIVAVKAGRSAMGQQATASHTGKIASSHRVYADILDQAGVLLVNSLSEALAALEVFAFLPNPRVSGDDRGGVSIMSVSGGAGALLADYGDQFGVRLAQFSLSTQHELGRILPDFAHKANPVDLTGQTLSAPELFQKVCTAISADSRTEAVVVQFGGGAERNLNANAEVFKSTVQQAGFPMVISFVGETMSVEVREHFRRSGILLSPDPEGTMRALSWLYKRSDLEGQTKVAQRNPMPRRAAPTNWSETMAYLRDSGVEPVKWRILGPDDRAADACADMTYPLVVKVLPSEAEHKTELGLVKLRVGSPDEVDAHAAEFRRRLNNSGLAVLVQEMVTEGLEVVLSCLRKTDFGPVLSVGTGGVAIELYRDVTHLALPVAPEQVEAALKKLKLWTLLKGFRGKPTADIESLVNATVLFGEMFLATSEIEEVEVNPLIVGDKGKGVVAVDALVVSAT